MTITNRRPKIAVLQPAAADDGIVIPPFPKRSLPKDMEGDWIGIINYMASRSLWAPEKASLIEAYLVNVHIMRTAKQAMDEAGGPVDADGKPHPSSPIIARHSSAASKIASQCGIGKVTTIEEPSRFEKKKSAWEA
jgi:hypothetical protein